jgi:hypothetical protein
MPRRSQATKVEQEEHLDIFQMLGKIRQITNPLEIEKKKS